MSTRPRVVEFNRAAAPAWRALAAAGLAALAAGCGPAAESGPVELSFGHVGAPDSLYDVTAREFARRVETELGDRVRIRVYGSSQLGGDEVMLQKLRLGTVDLALPSTVMSSSIAAFGLFEMPYLVRDRAHMRQIEERVFWDRLAPLARAEGLEVLAVWENGFRHVTSNVRPVHAPGDLAGIKLRTPRGLWRVKMFQAYGANPTPMPIAEVFVALQTGVMDGQENPLTQLHSQQFQEVQRYLSLTGHVYTPAYVTAGSNRWQRLPETLRTELRRIAREMQPFVHTTAELLDGQLRAGLRDSGMEVNEVDRAAFESASRPIYEEFGREVDGGAELIAVALGTDAG